MAREELSRFGTLNILPQYKFTDCATTGPASYSEITSDPIRAAALGGRLWYYSGQLLFPSWRAKDLSLCDARTEKYWGAGCGNLRMSRAFKFQEVKIPSVQGFDLPGWYVATSENGLGPAQGAVLLVHGGGSDRREESRYIKFFLGRKLDVLTLDLGCHGEAPCFVPGMTFGHRESRDVLSAYLYLTERHARVYAMGTSVGATSILISLPSMPRLVAVIAENPMFSFQRFVLETTASPSFIPTWFKNLVIRLTLRRGRFDGQASAHNSLRIARGVPIFFLHSKKDDLIPWRHTQELFDEYAGPKEIWITEEGEHAALWNVDPAAYEARLTKFLNNIR